MQFAMHRLIGVGTRRRARSSRARSSRSGRPRRRVRDLGRGGGAEGPGDLVRRARRPSRFSRSPPPSTSAIPTSRSSSCATPAAAGIAARVIQESEAGAATASFFIGDVAQLIPLDQRGLAAADARPGRALGVDPALATTTLRGRPRPRRSACWSWNKQRVPRTPICRRPGTSCWPSAGAARSGQWSAPRRSATSAKSYRRAAPARLRAQAR